VIMVYAGTKGYIDNVPVGRIAEYEKSLLQYIQGSSPGLLEGLAAKKDLTEELEGQLKKALTDFAGTWK